MIFRSYGQYLKSLIADCTCAPKQELVLSSHLISSETTDPDSPASSALEAAVAQMSYLQPVRPAKVEAKQAQARDCSCLRNTHNRICRIVDKLHILVVVDHTDI